jgi:N-acetylglucosaminyl-diphospho-decaprenol L-rhamnosyltransferase
MKSSEAEVSVIVVTYRNGADIEQCLRTVGTSVLGNLMELIIVDNASDDQTVESVRAVAPYAAVIQRADNGGFAQGCRSGVKEALGRWLLFLNPDAVLSSDAIEALLDCAQRHPGAGIVGGRFIREDGSDDPHSWWGKPTVWSSLCFALGLSTLFPLNPIFDPESPRPWGSNKTQERTVPIVSGAFMLVKREAWDDLHGFDPTFLLYGEDADFCLRATAAGYRPMVTPRAVCRHIGGKSSAGANRLILLFTGKCTLVYRHFPRGLRSTGIGLLLIGVFLRALGSLLFRTFSPSRQGRPTASGEDWRQLWKARRRWRHGWNAQMQLDSFLDSCRFR